MAAKAHPTSEELAAYTLGRLEDEVACEVESHIQSCEPCCETMVGITSEDTFVELLQNASFQAPSEIETAADFQNSKLPADDEGEIPTPLAQHPRYEIIRQIGRGGMGRVFKASHRMMGRSVAIKVIHQAWVRRPEAIERFHREVQTAASLDHPNIVTAYDAEQAGDLHFLAMEYVDGVNLAETVSTRGPLPVAEACEYVRQVAIGLEYAHQRGMVHRDIKPHNLMVTGESTIKILDFGLASLVPSTTHAPPELQSDSQLTVAGSIMGTPDFIAPEQAKDARQADIRSDIYSLGMTLYFLLAGRVPFPDGTAATKLQHHAELEPTPLSIFRKDMPDELTAIFAKMTAKNPSNRYQSPSEVADALLAFSSRDPSKQSKLGATAAAPKMAVAPLSWIAIAALICVGIGYGILKWGAGPAQVTTAPPTTTTLAQQVKNDVESLQGLWQVAYAEDSGELASPAAMERIRTIRVEFRANMLKTNFGFVEKSGTFKLDPSTNPKSIDIKQDGRIVPGIYDLNGDTLQLCFSENSDQRPDTFETRPSEKNTGMLVLKRFRPEDAASKSKQLDHSGPLTKEIAVSLIPEAASIPNDQFLEFAKSGLPNAVQGKPLSLVLMMLADFEGDLKRDFQYLVQGLPKPATVARAMIKSQPDGYVTMIQRNYITECSVSKAVPGEPTRGFVSFNAPQLYLGSVTFEASRHEGKWRIEKFSLIAHKKSVVLGKDGRWQQIENDPEIADPVALKDAPIKDVISGLRKLNQLLELAENKSEIKSPEIQKLAEQLQMQLHSLLEDKPFEVNEPTVEQCSQINSFLENITKKVALIPPTRSGNNALNELYKLSDIRPQIKELQRALQNESETK